VAEDIEAEQARLVRWKLRAAADPVKAEQARVLHKTAELIDRLGRSPEALAQLGFRRPAAGARRRSGCDPTKRR